MNEELRIKTKIQTFRDLIAWQEAHKLVLLTYTLTKNFPREEIYSLTDQMRRCAISITSNIAEGFSRQSYKEKVQFYSVALGSLTELQNQLIVAHDVGYISTATLDSTLQQSLSAHKLINGLIRSSKSIIRNS